VMDRKLWTKSMGSNRRDLEQYLALRWQDRQQAQSNSARVFEHLVLR
jgi:hypothetical protein